ncbi:MAG: OmpH family outer membrane protein [Weeksellaceae bacterium]|nr:OmpH family outer membrane protein [Weeksellaceae bacterium]
MKKIFTLSFVLLLSLQIQAQRFGYVDTEYILANLPEYAQANERVNSQAENWAREITVHEAELERLELNLQTERVLLTKEQLAQREEVITEKRTLIKDLQNQRYGPNGDLINIRRTIVKPIQDQIWNAVKRVAERRNYNFVFDKGSDLSMLYTDPKFDISEEVLRTLRPDMREGQSTRPRPGATPAQTPRTQSAPRTTAPKGDSPIVAPKLEMRRE